MSTFTPPRVSLDWTDGVCVLRLFRDSDTEDYSQSKIYPSWIVFAKADDYIVARLRTPLGNNMLVGMYKDWTFEWSDEILHNVEVHADIATNICVWCEQSRDQATGLWQDESVNHQPGDRPHVVTPGELHNRLAESIYLGAHAALSTIGKDVNRTKEDIAQDVTRYVLGSLSGRSSTLPAFKLVVDQSPVDVRIREMAQGDRFTNGDEVKPNVTTMVRRARQFSAELTADIQNTVDEMMQQD